MGSKNKLTKKQLEKRRKSGRDSYWKYIDKNRRYKRERARKDVIGAKRRARKHYLKNKKAVIKRTMAYSKVKRVSDPIFKLKERVRNRVRDSLKHRGLKKKYNTLKYLGCTWEELRYHLENQFKPGMTWRSRTKWHIDHIIPLSLFDLTKKEQQEVAFHVTNLQPLWAVENLRKGGR